MKKLQSNPATTVEQPEVKKLKKYERQKWCRFKARGRAYLAGVLMEPDQEIELSPADAYAQRNNKNIDLISGEIPVFDHPLAAMKNNDMTPKERIEFKEAELEWIESALDSGDPKLGAAPISPDNLKLVKQ